MHIYAEYLFDEMLIAANDFHFPSKNITSFEIDSTYITEWTWYKLITPAYTILMNFILKKFTEYLNVVISVYSITTEII